MSVTDSSVFTMCYSPAILATTEGLGLMASAAAPAAPVGWGGVEGAAPLVADMLDLEEDLRDPRERRSKSLEDMEKRSGCGRGKRWLMRWEREAHPCSAARCFACSPLAVNLHSPLDAMSSFRLYPEHMHSSTTLFL